MNRKNAKSLESSDQKDEKSRQSKAARPKCSQPIIWTETEKLQLAEAIDMFGTKDPNRLASRVPTKTAKQVVLKLRQLNTENRKEIEKINKGQSLINLNDMDDLFLVSGTQPKDVMVKWMDYLESIFDKEPYTFNQFKLLSSSFLIMSECMPPPKTTGPNVIDFRNVYYFLYRIINNYPIMKFHGDTKTRIYLHKMFLRVMEDINITSDEEKIAMYKIVSNWTSVNRKDSLKVYGNSNRIVTEQAELDIRKKEIPGFKVLETPMIPSFNPFQIKNKKMF